MPAGARKQLAQSQNTAKADPEGTDDAKSDGILGSLRVCSSLTALNSCSSWLAQTQMPALQAFMLGSL